MAENIAETDSSPYRSTDCRSTPIESNGLLHHVLLFSAVASAHECYWQLSRLKEPEKVLHCQSYGPLHEPGDLDLPIIPHGTRDISMIPHVVK